MKFIRKRELAGFTWFLLLLSVAVNCRPWSSQAVSTLTVAEVESMANRATTASQATGNEPELPRVLLDTTLMPPTGRTIAVAAGGNFQEALNQAQPGDVITLQAGASFTGNFTLPAKTGSGWIIIRSSAPDSSLPPPGSRITPSHASALPKILTPNSAPALFADSGAHHYRLIGLEFSQAPSSQGAFSLLLLGERQTSLAQLPHNLILDRVYIHGLPTVPLRRGVALNSASSAIIDSHISECHENGADSQAIMGWSGPGPYKIVNNYLEGAGENVLFGGDDPTIPNLVPSDIEFRRNHCFKPLTWKADDPSYGGRRWTVKNLFELKNAQRLLIEGNIFEHNWANAQIGYAIVFTVRGGTGAPWSTVQDVTFINNIVRHSGAGVNIHGFDNNGPSVPSKRIRISNNLFDDIDSERWGKADGKFLLIASGPAHVTVEHNTVFHSNHIAEADEPPPSMGFIFRNNILPNNEFGFFGSGQGTGTPALDHYFPGAIFKRNVIVGGQSAQYPPDNFFPGTFEAVRFVDRAGGNYRLAASSPYKNAGTSGRDIGCDFDLLHAALNGASAPSNVSAASFSGATLAPESIATAFGTGLSTATLAAFAAELPTQLAGTTVKVRDSAGTERLSPLFFVSPTQVNYLVPQGTTTGSATVAIASSNGGIALGAVNIAAVSPGIFTADASGRGLPAAVALRIKADGSQHFEPVVRFDPAQNKLVAVPIDLGTGTERVFLILSGTGIRFRSSPAATTAKIGGADVPVVFSGAQGVFAGLDQVNVSIPHSLAGRGEVDVALTVDGKATNIVRVNLK